MKISLQKLSAIGEICNACAISAGADGGNGVCTMWSGVCPVCKKKKALCSTFDYDWPHLKRKAVFD